MNRVLLFFGWKKNNRLAGNSQRFSTSQFFFCIFMTKSIKDRWIWCLFSLCMIGVQSTSAFEDMPSVNPLSESQYWQLTTSRNTKEAYQFFLHKFIGSSYSALANSKITELEQANRFLHGEEFEEMQRIVLPQALFSAQLPVTFTTNPTLTHLAIISQIDVIIVNLYSREIEAYLKKGRVTQSWGVFDNQAQRFLLASEQDTNTKIQLYHLPSGKLEHQRITTGKVTALTLNPNGSLYATANDSGEIHIHNVAQDRNVSTFSVSTKNQLHIAFSMDSQLILINDPTFPDGKMYDLQTGRVVFELFLIDAYTRELWKRSSQKKADVWDHPNRLLRLSQHQNHQFIFSKRIQSSTKKDNPQAVQTLHHSLPTTQSTASLPTNAETTVPATKPQSISNSLLIHPQLRASTLQEPSLHQTKSSNANRGAFAQSAKPIKEDFDRESYEKILQRVTSTMQEKQTALQKLFAYYHNQEKTHIFIENYFQSDQYSLETYPLMAETLENTNPKTEVILVSLAQYFEQQSNVKKAIAYYREAGKWSKKAKYYLKAHILSLDSSDLAMAKKLQQQSSKIKSSTR